MHINYSRAVHLRFTFRDIIRARNSRMMFTLTWLLKRADVHLIRHDETTCDPTVIPAGSRTQTVSNHGQTDHIAEIPSRFDDIFLDETRATRTQIVDGWYIL